MEVKRDGKPAIENVSIVPAPEFPAFALLKGEYTPVSDSNPRLAVIHLHNLIELGHCVEGSGTVNVDGKCLRYRAGDVTFIPARVPHAIKADEGGEHFWEYFYFDPELFAQRIFSENAEEQRNFSQYSHKIENLYTPERDAEVVNDVETILEEMRRKPPDYRMMVRVLTSKLVLALSRRAPKEEPEPMPRNKLSVMPAIDYIQDHFCENLYIEDLAVMCFMSPASFRRKFKEATGHTALETVNHYRILKACDLLTQTDMSVREISAAVGFDSISGFCRRFSDVMGVTPLKWKNSAKYKEGKEKTRK